MASDASHQLFALSRLEAAVRSSNEGGVEALVRGLREIAVGSGLSLPQGGPAAADRDAPARRHAPISLRKFLPFAQRLISRVASDHLSLMSERDRAEAFDCFFDGRAFPQVVQNPCFSPCIDCQLLHQEKNGVQDLLRLIAHSDAGGSSSPACSRRCDWSKHRRLHDAAGEHIVPSSQRPNPIFLLSPKLDTAMTNISQQHRIKRRDVGGQMHE